MDFWFESIPNGWLENSSATATPLIAIVVVRSNVVVRWGNDPESLAGGLMQVETVKQTGEARLLDLQ